MGLGEMGAGSQVSGVRESTPESRIPDTRHPTPDTLLASYTKFVAASTLFLIFAGAMVTSTGSGLAVPDWPLSYGMLMPPMVGGIFYEHGHRMIAATVGLLTVIQAIWLQLREPKRFVRLLGWTAVGAVIAQGILGGITVRFLLPPAVSIAHAGLAEIFLGINVAIAFFTSASFIRIREARASSAAARSTTILSILVYGQILLGALMRHLGAGLAIPDFPLSFGRVVPDLSSTHVAINYAHRLGALLVVTAGIVVVMKLWRDHVGETVKRLSLLLLMALAAQIALGAYTVWSGKHPVVTSFHVMTGAATLAISLLLCLATRSSLQFGVPDHGVLLPDTQHPAPNRREVTV